MSEAGLADGRHTDAARPVHTGRSPWPAVLVGGLSLLTAGLLAWRADAGTAPWLVWILAALGALGVAGLVGGAAGVVHVGRLPRQRAFFDALIDAVGERCLVTDRRGRPIYCNAAYRQFAGEHGRLLGIENLYAGYPDISEKVYRLAQAARDRRPAMEEFRLAPGSAAAGARPDAAVWARVTVSPLATGLGQDYTLWRMSDITADRQRQEDTFAHLQYIISFLDRAPAGFFSTESDGRIAYVNATLAEWLGIDLARTTDGQLSLPQLVGEEAARLLSSVKPRPGEVVTEVFDLDLAAADGKPMPVRIIHRSDFDGTGRPQPSRSLVVDRRAAAVSEGADSEAAIRLQRLFHNAPIGMALIDASGRVVEANGALVALTDEAVRGADLADLVRPEHREAVRQAVSRVFVGEPQTRPLGVAFAGDGQRTGELLVSRLDGARPAAGSAVVYVLDTTKHSSLEVQLAQGQKMHAVGQLAGGVAHDFNNVLTAIIGFSDLLLARHRPTDPAFADIMNIKQNANRAANLVRQLLAFSRRQTLRPEVLSLTDVLSDLGNLLGRLLGEKVTLKIVHGRDLGLVKVDLNQFEQVIINLAVNARDAMKEGGTVTIRTSNVTVEGGRAVTSEMPPEGDYVLCEVEDTGTGMPPEVVAKIYEPFFSTKEVGKGTGLGLSMVYGIIKQTGGYIFCDSAVGKGTTFRIYLPRHAETRTEPAAKAEEKKEAKRADLTGKGTILLVEDEDAVRAFASRALATRGYTVIEAESGEEALKRAAEHQGGIDLVLSDVVMPEMDGPTLLRELRKRGHSMKVVFISGYAEDAFEKNLEGQEDFAFLAKPFTLKQLAEAVKAAMDA
jgi:two-component system cell cycle sensor histidine kinase/response regulator CckA